jgi:hypothetical protein
MPRSVVVLFGTLASFGCARTTPNASTVDGRPPTSLRIPTQDNVSLEVKRVQYGHDVSDEAVEIPRAFGG